jgi:uncharacterized protein
VCEKPVKNLIILGQSLGGSLGMYAAATTKYKECIKGVVADSAFADYREIVRDKLDVSVITKYLKWPLSFLVSNEYRPLNFVADISPIPLLLIHGTADEVVPVRHAKLLFEKAKDPKELWIVEGVDHIQALNVPEWRKRLVEWMGKR